MPAQQFRYALRTLRRTPGFTAAAVLCLALGIAVNTTVFSIFDALVLRPFAFPEPERLVVLQPRFRANQTNYLSGPEFAAVRDTVRSLASITAVDFANRNLTGQDVPERLATAFVTEGLVETYGMLPILGRGFTAGEHRADRSVVLISHRLWERRFQSDPRLPGRTIGIGGVPHTVVGVLPPRFLLGEQGLGGADLYLPFTSDPAQSPRGFRAFVVAGRMRPGATPAQLQAELEVAARAVERDHATEQKEYAGWRLAAVPVSRSTDPALRTAAMVLFVAVAAVLAIACVNVANLLLARAARRSREIAVRRAVGATRGQLLAQFLAEGLVLSSAGGVLAFLLSYWGVDVLIGVLPRHIDVLPAGIQIAVNARTFGFTAVLVLLSGVLFGLAPVLQREPEQLSPALHEGARGMLTARARRVAGGLVALQMALSVVLLIGTGVAVRSYLSLTGVDPGFDPDGVALMRTTLPANRYSGPRVTDFFRRWQERAASVPGVTAAGVVNQFPPAGFAAAAFQVETASPREPLQADLSIATGGYFDALRVPVRAGRIFEARDDTAAGPPVAIVNEQFARAAFGAENAVGRRLRLSGDPNAPWATIIGVVATVKNRGLDKPSQPEVFLPLAADRGQWNQLWLVVRTAGDPLAVVPAIREQMRSIDPEQPLYLPMSMQQALQFFTLPRRAAAWLLAVFAGLALLLAAVGLYGVVSYTVARRTREIGVRVALGASAGDVLRLVFSGGMMLAGAGAAAGIAAAAVLARIASGAVYGIAPHDPLVFFAAPAVLLLVTAGATLLPARRAARVDPVVALRYD